MSKSNVGYLDVSIIPMPMVTVLPYCSSSFYLDDTEYSGILRKLITENQPFVLTKSEQRGTSILPERFGVLCGGKILYDDGTKIQVAVTGISTVIIESLENEKYNIIGKIIPDGELDFPQPIFEGTELAEFTTLKDRLLKVYDEMVMTEEEEVMVDELFSDPRAVINNCGLLLFDELDKQYFLEETNWEKKISILHLLGKGLTMDVIKKFSKESGTCH